MNLSKKTVLVVDNGLNLHVPIKLAESFGTVTYFCPWTGNGFPSEKQRQIGTGIPGVQRVMDMWSAARDADIVVFSFIYFHDEAAQLRLMGKPVWGAGYAEALEVERLKTRQAMEAIGMDVIPYEVIIGSDALREYLADKDDVWIKASVTRGDWETFHWQGDHLSRPKLEKNLRAMGPRAKTKEFVVEFPVPGCETGYDGYCIDGRFPATAMFGFEQKDAGYVMQVCPFDRLPSRIHNPTLQFGQLLGELGCRGWFSNEIRISEEGTPFLIDPTCRCGSPPSESYIELFSNWAEVIWAGAHGEMIDLEPVAKYGAQIILKSTWVGDDGEAREYLPVRYPEEIARWIKLHNYCILDGEVTVTPQIFPEFGAAIGLGDTLEEAQKNAMEHAEQVEALELDYRHDIWDETAKCLEEGKKYGVGF